MYGYPPDRHDHWEITNDINDVKRELSSVKYNDDSNYSRLEYRVTDLEYALEDIKSRLYDLETRTVQ